MVKEVTMQQVPVSGLTNENRDAALGIWLRIEQAR